MILFLRKIETHIIVMTILANYRTVLRWLCCLLLVGLLKTLRWTHSNGSELGALLLGVEDVVFL